MFSKVFLLSTAERAVKTFAQSLLAVLLGSGAFDLFTADWKAIVATAATATVISVLTSIASLGAGPSGSASLVVTETSPTIDEEV